MSKRCWHHTHKMSFQSSNPHKKIPVVGFTKFRLWLTVRCWYPSLPSRVYAFQQSLCIVVWGSIHSLIRPIRVSWVGSWTAVKNIFHTSSQHLRTPIILSQNVLHYIFAFRTLTCSFLPFFQSPNFSEFVSTVQDGFIHKLPLLHQGMEQKNTRPVTAFCAFH